MCFVVKLVRANTWQSVDANWAENKVLQAASCNTSALAFCALCFCAMFVKIQISTNARQIANFAHYSCKLQQNSLQHETNKRNSIQFRQLTTGRRDAVQSAEAKKPQARFVCFCEVSRKTHVVELLHFCLLSLSEHNLASRNSVNVLTCELLFADALVTFFGACNKQCRLCEFK